MPNGRDKNWVRLCAAVEGFRNRYGRWPTHLRLPPGAMENLEGLFRAQEFATIRAKLQFVADGSGFVAQDGTGSSYNYGAEGFPEDRFSPRAHEWFGVKPAHPD